VLVQEEQPPVNAALLRKLYGPILTLPDAAEIESRSSACDLCPLRIGVGYCGEPRCINPLAPRDESRHGNGMMIERRIVRPECRCPRGLWEATGKSERKTADVTMVDGKRVSFFIGALGHDNAAASMLADQIADLTGAKPFLLDERTPGVATNKANAPFYCHEFLAPDTDYLIYLSGELFLGEIPPLRFADVSLYRLPSVIERYYPGFFVASRNTLPLMEWCRDLKAGEGFESFVVLAERSAQVETLPASLFFPMRSALRGPSKCVSLLGVDVEGRNRLLKQMHQSPKPWREICRHFGWADDLRDADPYPEGTMIDFDCEHAGIGDLIDVAHIANAIEIENPGVSVRIHAKEAKEGFVELFGRLGPMRHGSLVHTLPPSPWHKLDAGARGSRIENWAVYSGASAPVLAQPLIGAEADAWADEFLKDLPKPVVVMSPVSTCLTRSWPIEQYGLLGVLLERAGHGIVMMDDPDGVITKKTRFKRLFGAGAEREAAVIRKCGLMVGNDSGMVHLSAALTVPTLVLCGPTDGNLVFRWYKSTKCIDGLLPCKGCYFYRERGWGEECEHGCLSMHSISVKQVLRACLQMLVVDS